MDYAFDTNTVIHLMRGTPSVRKHRDRATKSGARLILPPFVNYEILRGLIIKPIEKHEKAYRVICDNCSIGEMTENVWRRAAHIYAELYNKHFTVKDADIVIAAYCFEHCYTLVTNNTKDFINIDGLQLVDWTKE